jgi:hypothetical protein
MAATSNIATESEKRELIITREFDAPRALVFKAGTDPNSHACWLGPQGFTTISCEDRCSSRRPLSLRHARARLRRAFVIACAARSSSRGGLSPRRRGRARTAKLDRKGCLR